MLSLIEFSERLHTGQCLADILQYFEVNKNVSGGTELKVALKAQL